MQKYATLRKLLSIINQYAPLLPTLLFTLAYYPNHLRCKLINRVMGRVPLERKILSKSDTINKIIDGVSVLRFGDGEIRLIADEDLPFQNSEPGLVCGLKATLCAKQDGLLICLPNIFSIEKNWALLKDRFFWDYHLANYYSIYSSLTYATQEYGDSYIFRATIGALKNDEILDYASYYNAIISIWDKKSIVIIEGKYSRNGVGNDLFDGAKTIERILCPPIHAYSCYDRLLNYCLTLSKNKLILLSIGPSSKILGYKLWEMGYRVIDIGHLDANYDAFLAKRDKIVCSKFKHSPEINDNRLSNVSFINKKYESEIIMDFS